MTRFFIIGLVALVTIGCSSGAPGIVDTSAIQTQSAQTVVAQITENAPKPTQTPFVITATAPPTTAVPPTEIPTTVPTAVPAVPTDAPVATATERVIVVTATSEPTTVERVIVVTATRAPLPQNPPPTAQPGPAAQSTGFIYPAPSAGGTCGSTLAPGDFILQIAFSQQLKADEAFDIRSRHANELNTPTYRGVAVTRETQHIIRAKVNNPDTWPDAFGSPAWGHNFLSVAVIRLDAQGKFAAQLSPESGTCELVW